MAFAQFFVLNARGETIISRDYRGEVPKTSADYFFKEAIASQTPKPPCFNFDGINFAYVKKQGLYFVLTSLQNVSPSFSLELVASFMRVFKDYCGLITEEAIRRNFTLIYELLDELMDYGYPQGTSTEQLQNYVLNTAESADGPFSERKVNEVLEKIVTPKVLEKISGSAPMSTSTQSANRPVTKTTGNKEIFVDLAERLIGQVVNAQADGSITLRNFLVGAPEVILSLNDDFVIGSGSYRSKASAGATVLDDCNFNEIVNSETFVRDRTITFSPPPGEMVVMNYRVNSIYNLPFHINVFVDETAPTKIEVHSEYPPDRRANNVVVQFPVPKLTTSVFFETGVGAAEFNISGSLITWSVPNFPGSTEQFLRAKLTLERPSAGNIRKEIGPVGMNFEIPMWNCSQVQIRYLKVEDHSKQAPYRWIRMTTVSQSYVRRVS